MSLNVAWYNGPHIDDTGCLFLLLYILALTRRSTKSVLGFLKVIVTAIF